MAIAVGQHAKIYRENSTSTLKDQAGPPDVEPTHDIHLRAPWPSRAAQCRVSRSHAADRARPGSFKNPFARLASACGGTARPHRRGRVERARCRSERPRPRPGSLLGHLAQRRPLARAQREAPATGSARTTPRRGAAPRARSCGGAGEPSALRAAEEAVLPHARPWRRPALLPRTVPPRAAPSPTTWRPHETHPTEQRQRRRALPAPRVAHLRLGVAPPRRGARAQRRAPPRARPRWRLMTSRRAGRAAGLGGGHGERGRRRAREASDAAPCLAERAC